MVFYHCDVCNYDCKSMQIFNKHIASKNHLKLLELAQQKNNIPPTPQKYTCKICCKEYIRKKPFLTHQQKCNVESLQLNPMNCSGPQRITNITNNNTNNTNNTNSNNTTNNNINVTQNNNINLTQNTNNYYIMPFGQEDMSMITDDMRKYIISRGFSAYIILLDELYKHPQNNNIHLYDKRNKLVKYIDSNNNIKIIKFKDAIEDIVYTNLDMIDEFLDEHIDSLDEKQRKYATKLLDAHTNETKKKEKLKEYNTITDCKINEIAPQCKKNFDTLNKTNDPTPIKSIAKGQL